MKDPGETTIREETTILVRAAAIADDRGIVARPGCLLLGRSQMSGLERLNALRVAESIHPPPGAQVLDLPDDILIPGLVNAHCHLDLTSVGPRPAPEEGGFSAWLAMLRNLRPQAPDEIAASVRRGVELSLAGGVVAVGDIGGCVRSGPTPVPWQELRSSPLEGVSFLEFFSIGSESEARLAAVEAALESVGPDRSMLGLQPHAPYSVNLPGYRWAVEAATRLGLPLCTHLSESEEEVEFVAHASGRQRAFLHELGIWDDRELEWIGKNTHPVAHLECVLEQRPWVLAHVNDCTEEALAILARTKATVVYCPRAWRYFGFDQSVGPHQYRVMIERGVRVCLGTDSIVSLPEGSDCAHDGRISVLDEARALYQSDNVDAALLLRMITTWGAEALGLDASRYRFCEGGAIAGVVAVRTGRDDPLAALMGELHRPRLLLGPARG